MIVRAGDFADFGAVQLDEGAVEYGKFELGPLYTSLEVTDV
jgi:hypothetical protein